MILVDTSVWINHLRESEPKLEKLLIEGEVICHSYVIGELACGNIKNRDEILSLLNFLPLAPLIEFDEYLYFIDHHKLFAKGIGFVDIHLLASALLAQVKLWTRDKNLNTVATDLGISYNSQR